MRFNLMACFMILLRNVFTWILKIEDVFSCIARLNHFVSYQWSA